MNLDHRDKFAFLKGIALFRALPDKVIKNCTKHVEIMDFHKGSLVLTQKETAKGLYIVRSGLIEGAYWDRYNLKTSILLIKDKDYFGDLSVITDKSSQIGFQAIEDSQVLFLPKSILLNLLASYPVMTQNFFIKMSERQAKLANTLLEIRHRSASLQTIMKTVEEEAPFLVGHTEAMNNLWDKIPDFASALQPILIIGEFGVGKELLAEIIHSKSPLRNRPFIIVDASEISEDDWQERMWEKSPLLANSENHSEYLISRTKFGFLELANGGTLLLKNIDSLTPGLQEKIEKFLYIDKKKCPKNLMASGKIRGNMPQVKLIFTSHIDLRQRVKEGQFSSGLYDIIATQIICMPPLRERKRDILELAQHFIDKHSRRYNKFVNKLSHRSRELLLGYEFRRGNIQELDEIIERGVVLAKTDTIHSEQLFLGAPAGRAHVWFNFIKIKAFATLIYKGIYPELIRWIAVLFFFFIMFSCFLGPHDPTKNWGTILVWWIWWPWLCLAAFWIGRTWCSFCAYATLGNTLQKKFNLNLRFPKLFKDYDYIMTTLLFLLIVWVEEATRMRYYPLYTGMLLTFILCMELLFSVLFPRDTWCRYVCPMGNLIGVFAMTSIIEVRSNLDICAHECTTDDCYHGADNKLGCPMFQHMMFVDNNQTCKLCLQCIRLCPHRSVSLNLRPPGWEIWASNQVRPGMAIFVCTLMAVIFPVIRPFESIFFTTLAFLAAPLIIIAFLWTISFMSFRGAKGGTYRGFWKAAYGYVPLALAAHIVYQLKYIPWLRDLNYAIFLKGQAIINMNSGLYLIQACILCLGTLFSYYAIFRIARDKLASEYDFGLVFWLGHMALMTFYPLLVWYFLR